MLVINKIHIINFACFDEIEIAPSTCENRPLTVVRAENGAGKTTLLRAIRWGMYGETGLPGKTTHFSLHPASWIPDSTGIETEVRILFETDGSTRNHDGESKGNTEYELRRAVTTIASASANAIEPDFRRVGERTQLLVKEPDGSWVPHQHGVNSVVEELLPKTLQDFFVMDADEAADFVGGSENKTVNRQEAIAKTTFSVRALLGLEVFEKSMDRIKRLVRDFGRDATRATKSGRLRELQNELDVLHKKVEDLDKSIQTNRTSKADIDERLSEARARQQALLSSLSTHEELACRKEENDNRLKRVRASRQREVIRLSEDLVALDLLSSLGEADIRRARESLQPLYEDGSIPMRHRAFVQGLLDRGQCVCGQDLTSPGEYRRHVQQLLMSASGEEEVANYLAQVLHAANELYRAAENESWRHRVEEAETRLFELNSEIDELMQGKRDIDEKMAQVDDMELEEIGSTIAMLEEQASKLERALAGDQQVREECQTELNVLEGKVRSGRRRQAEARDLSKCETVASMMAGIIENALSHIRSDQVSELSREMNTLFTMMAANVMDDDRIVDGQYRATLRMIKEVGLREVDDCLGDYEIFALNSRGRAMPPTEINGASRRILALSFVLGLCKVSGTRAPLVADSLLNFLSGRVRTNTLEVAAKTASQPILLLTGSDLEAHSEVELVSRYAGATYTLTGQWQYLGYGGDVVNLTDARRVSLLCECGPREYCSVCERKGQAEDSRWTMHAVGVS